MFEKLFNKKNKKTIPKPNHVKPRDPKYLLYNRRTILKIKYNKDGTSKPFSWDFEKHEWKVAWSLYAKYIHGDDGIFEEIDYDEKKEEILDIRRIRGYWFGKAALEEECRPSKPVIDFFNRTGLTYGDLYRSLEQKDNEKYDLFDAFRDFDDLLPRFGKKEESDKQE